jgi:glutathione S-transferase
MAIVLYGNLGMTSPYVFSCMVALREKGLDFTIRTLHLEADEQHHEVFENPSITGRVPALDHGGRCRPRHDADAARRERRRGPREAA